MSLPDSLQRVVSVSRKEVIHILRDPATLFFALFIPIVELLMLGYAIDTNVRDVRTVVLDQAKNQDSWRLLERFVNSKDFRIVRQVDTDEQLHEEIVAGRARVGIKIPENYSRQLEAKEVAQVLVLVDGSESSVAAETVNVSNAIALRESLERVPPGQQARIEARPRVLFNPDTRSANFFIPGLIVVLSPLMAVLLSS